MGALRATALPRYIDWRQTREWNALVEAAPAPDVYYRPGYVRAYECVDGGAAVAVEVSVGESQFLFPLMLRPLDGLAFAPGTRGYDAVTPYGYGGMMRIAGPVELDRETLSAAFGGMRAWCAANDVVTVLLRLHPLSEQERWFKSGAVPDIVVRHFGPTVALDLTRFDETARNITTLARGRRSDLSFARRNLHQTWASQGGDRTLALGIFRRIYEGRMNQIQAADFYHFPPEYYRALDMGLGDRLDVAIAWADVEPVAGALFMFDRDYAHYHLSATTDDGRRLKATTLLINAAAAHARQRGCKWLHLGGGTRAADPLFQFKRSFGGQVFTYAFLNFVADRRRYFELVQQRRSATSLPALRPDFFPEYRA